MLSTAGIPGESGAPENRTPHDLPDTHPDARIIKEEGLLG